MVICSFSNVKKVGIYREYGAAKYIVIVASVRCVKGGSRHESTWSSMDANGCIGSRAVDGDDGEGTVCHTVFVARWC